MKVALNANIADETTKHLCFTLHPVFRELSSRLQGEYGGLIEHLWIDLELLQREGDQPLHPFRFQKRVSGRSYLGLPAVPDSFNVGHFSVKPDLSVLRPLSGKPAVLYALSSIHKASELLLQKQKKLGGFDATLFRNRFQVESKLLGYSIEA